ncbi:DNA polymerase [Aliidongia dinghuensis]|uniref:Type-4 uracil-DNA glycosylase n=1 Tax=Aliidongia dinghuensis TaxID=1867774 RepID=A0A8J2YTH5_9PROT|nr:uracil-DNA glycosylase [Aliidongia dinghuensis]GGF18235.1 DNA polymerase [Aliidongia dinghuensis]
MLRERLLEELLAWTLAMGADEAIGELAVDRFAESERRAQALAAGRAAPAQSPIVRPVAAPAAKGPVAPAPAGVAPPSAQRPTAAAPRPAPALDGGLGDTIAAARAAAAAAHDLTALRDAVLAFEGCALKKTATNTVFADGVPSGGLMLIGEAPGADEDRIGRPFVGVSGQLLDRMLAAIGRSRQSNVYITNTLFWRPPGNRKPTDSEIAICRPFVERHIALVRPRLLVLVGGTASAAMLPGSPGITRLRGQWLTLEVNGLAEPVQAIAMYHPSFLLRSPERKREAWADLLSIKTRLEEASK